jgi:predicted enzyme related to lactoylglutathione lyase
VADLGIQALLDDPSGARIGIWQPGTFAGFGPVGTGRPGTPAWFQLHPTDYPGSVSFYRDAFGASGLRHHHRQLITARRLGGAGPGSAARRG